MALIDDMVSAGWLDRAISRVTNLPPGQIGGSDSAFVDLRSQLRQESPYTAGNKVVAWRKLMDHARESVNRARLMASTGQDGPIPAEVDRVDSGTALGSKSLQYHVVVVVKDPDTGGTNRVLVVLKVGGSISQQQLASLATTPETIKANWRTTGKRGEIAPTNYQVVQVVILGVVGRK